MLIKQIRIHELLDFIESGEYKKSNVIPITKFRAISQANNPRADSDDIVLTIAYNDSGEIIAWVGALPDLINDTVKVAWNSGWFADSKEGGQIALPLFLQFVKNYHNRVVFQDLTSHTTRILKALPGFKFISEKQGIRVFYRFYLSEIIVNKFPYLKIIQWIFSFGDFVGNVFQNQRIKIWKKGQSAGISLNITESVDQETKDFIDTHNKKEVFQRSKEELEWILKYKWVEESDSISNEYKKRYHFTSVVSLFRYFLLKFYNNKELIGFIILKQRDKIVDTPYVYLNEKYKQAITIELLRFIFNLKINSFVTYNPFLLDVLSKLNYPKLYQKKLKRDIVISSNLTTEINKEAIIQDGDGDVVFT